MRDSFFFSIEYDSVGKIGTKGYIKIYIYIIKCEEWVEMNLDSREKIRREQKLKRKRSPEMKKKMSPFTGYTFFFLFFSPLFFFFFFFFARAKVPRYYFCMNSRR